MQLLRTQKLDQLRRVVALNARRAAADRIVPEIRIVRRPEAVDVNTRLCLPRDCNDLVFEIASVEGYDTRPQLLDELRGDIDSSRFGHHCNARLELLNTTMQLHAAIHDDLVFHAELPRSEE